MTSKDYYQVLGLTPNATQDEIAKSFKKLAVKCHPDKTKDPAQHELFITINEAYEVLKSEDTRRKYDMTHNIFATNHNSHNPYGFNSRFSTSSTRSTNNFSYSSFDTGTNFYSRHYESRFTTDDMVQKQRQATMEKIRRDAELKAQREKEARLAKEAELKRQADLAKKQAAKAKRDAEIELARLKQEQQEILKHQQPSAKSHDQEYLYNQRKRQAYTAHWNQPFRNFNDDVFQTKSSTRLNSDRSVLPEKDTNGHGTKRSDPIVIESEVEGDVEIIDDNINDDDITSATPEPSYVQKPEPGVTHTNRDNGKSPPSNNDTANLRPSGEEFIDGSIDVEEIIDDSVPMENDVELEPSTQPQIPRSENLSNQTNQSNSQQNNDHHEPWGATNEVKNVHDNVPNRNESAPKRRTSNSNGGEQVLRALLKKRRKDSKKPFLFDDLKDTLKPNIEDVDFQDLLDNLQNTGKKQNTKEAFKPSKKPRLSEYSDGSSKAQTLYTPVNQNQFKHKASTSQGLNMIDFNANPKVKTIKPPTPPDVKLPENLDSSIWKNYITAIKRYQQDFLAYKTKIITYQMERASRDQELNDIINEHESNFDIYEDCLEQDVQVLKHYNDLLLVFNTIMKLHRFNCHHWKHKFEL